MIIHPQPPPPLMLYNYYQDPADPMYEMMQPDEEDYTDN